MSQRDDLLRFLVERKIPLRLAINILEDAEKKLKEKWKPQEMAVLTKYETRGKDA